MMRFRWDLFKRELKARREGMIVGAVAGFFLANHAISKGADLNTIVTAGEGLLDGLMGRNAAAMEIAKYKLYGVFMTVGAVVGYYLDIFYDEIGLPRKGRNKRKVRRNKNKRRR